MPGRSCSWSVSTFLSFILFPHALGNSKGNSRTTKDGYYAKKVPKVLYSAYLVPAEQTFEALNNIVDIYVRHEREDVAFEWNFPGSPLHRS